MVEFHVQFEPGDKVRADEACRNVLYSSDLESHYIN